MANPEHVSLIIPAYNESGIQPVIEAGLGASKLDKIIVVDDGSTDSTGELAEVYSDEITVLHHDHNRGKGESMQLGYQVAKSAGSTALLFLDADLHNLTPAHVDSLVKPVVAHEASMTIGILERTRMQQKVLKFWGGLSGQRALPLRTWENLSDEDRHGFNVEAALNARARYNGTHHRIKRLELSGVTHTGLRQKESNLAKAGIAYVHRYGSALATYARIGLDEFFEGPEDLSDQAA